MEPMKFAIPKQLVVSINLNEVDALATLIATSTEPLMIEFVSSPKRYAIELADCQIRTMVFLLTPRRWVTTFTYEFELHNSVELIASEIARQLTDGLESSVK